MGVFCPSGHSREWNPDEMVCADWKKGGTKRALARTKRQLLKAAACRPRCVGRKPGGIKKPFEQASVGYAA